MTINAKAAKDLDRFDHAILAEVQNDNQLTHAEIGARVGLSTSAVRRRLKALNASGVILNNVALLDPDMFGVTLIVEIAFLEERPGHYDAFNQKMQALPNVLQSYSVAGQSDYILIVLGPSLQWYEKWSTETFMGDPNIRRASTRVAWSCKKNMPFITTDQAQ